MKVTIYTANCTGNRKNTSYPRKCAVDNETDFLAAVEFDHVCAAFRNHHRAVEDYLESDVDVMDCDNDHSDDPREWKYPKDIEALLPDVSFILVPSRHNMLPKDGKSARPRYHIYFPHERFTEEGQSAALKAALLERFPFFDANAVDSARFIFGNRAGEIIWHEGEVTIDCVLRPQGRTIPQGQRNTTLNHFAGRVLKRYGESDRAYTIFLEEAAKCDPPLDDEELATIWQSACRFARKVSSQEGYIPPEEYEFNRQSLKPTDYSDIGQAKVLAREYGNELKYTVATDYLRYGGQYWAESRQQSVGAMEEFLDLQLEDAKDEVERAKEALIGLGVSEKDISAGGKTLERRIGADQTKAYLAYISALAYRAFVMKRRDMKYVVSALQAAKPMLEVAPSDLDREPFLLNCPDGTYDLSLGMAGRRDHNPTDLITKMCSVAPGDEGGQLWENFLNRVFLGDQELIGYVQRIAGLGAIGAVYLEAIIISYGEGANGKSTFWNTVSWALGTYAGGISADALTVGCRRNVKPEIAEAKGKRLLIAAELEEGMRLSTSIVKQLCSTDQIKGEKKYKDPFDFVPSHTLVLYTNHLPKVGAMDRGIWRRLIVIPFNATIQGKDDVKNYAEHLQKNAGPSILKWIIEGAQKAIAEKFIFNVPQVVEDAMGRYRSDSDWMGHFIEECCEVGEGLFEKSGDFYNAYRSFCARTGDFVRDSATFYAAVEQCGFTRFRKTSGRFVGGVRLKAEDLPD